MMTLGRNAIALIASLALNLFLIAGIITVYAPKADGAAGWRSGHAVLHEAAMSLDPAYSRTFIALLRAEGGQSRTGNLQARTLRKQAWGALETPSFDPAQAKLKLAQARTLNEASRHRIEDAVVDFAATLPPAQRAKLGKAMSQR
jgi:uncharacterized membrane protein